MKDVFIIGSRGYHANYGGWETFVSNLVDNYNDDSTIFHISEITDDKEKKEYKVNDNILVKPIYVGNLGSARMLLYTIRAFRFYYSYIIKNNIKKSYMYILGLKMGNVLKLYRDNLKKHNIKVLVNPDGLEWKRSKWNILIKKFFLYSEKSMLNNCDVIVCDAKGIKKYVDSVYPSLKNKTIYIAYGTNKISFKDIDEKSVLEEFSLKKNNYCLMVGRCVPENNYELVIKEFMKSNIKKDLLIISNVSSSNYFNELKEKLNIDSDERIKVIDGVYDNIKFAVIRKNAYLYIHGHSVGGTNPSLLEALSLTNLNILYNVNFNKDVGRNSCLYFDEEKSLSKILDNKELLDSSKKELGKKAKDIIKNDFTWEIIVNKYKKLFK